jgi:transcriptional regulator with XRE-family HTH domain
MECRAPAGLLVRRSGLLDQAGDPACWSWPVPHSIAFPSAKTARAFLRQWNHCCAICTDQEALVLDHDHETMLIRGYICKPCNVQEGRSAGSLDDVFARYRERNPATMLGIRTRYVAPQVETAPHVFVSADAEFAAERERAIGHRLQQARVRAGLSQAQVAEAMTGRGRPMSQQTVAKIEWGKRPLMLFDVLQFTDILDADMEEITGEPREVTRLVQAMTNMRPELFAEWMEAGQPDFEPVSQRRQAEADHQQHGD